MATGYYSTFFSNRLSNVTMGASDAEMPKQDDVERGREKASNTSPATGLKMSAECVKFVRQNFLLPDKEENRSFGYLGSTQQRPFIRLDGRHVDDEYMAAVYQLLTQYWNIKPPDAIFEITGSAEELKPEVSNKLEPYFSQLKQQWAEKNVWVFTGGNHCGCMALAGRSLGGDHKGPVLIGTSTWITRNKSDLELLQNADGSLKPYENYQRDKRVGKQVDLDHHVLMLIDNGKNAVNEKGVREGWGEDVDFRNRFINYVIKRRQKERAPEQVPVCIFLIGGGPNSFKAIKLAITAQRDGFARRAVIFNGSGRAASVLEKIFKKLGDDSKSTLKNEQVVNELTAEDWQDLLPGEQNTEENRRKTINRVIEIVIRKQMLRFDDASNEQISADGQVEKDRVQLYVDNNFEHRKCLKFQRLADKDEKEAFEKRWPSNDTSTEEPPVCICGRKHEHAGVSEEIVPVKDFKTEISACDTIRCGIIKFKPSIEQQNVTAKLQSLIPSYSNFVRLFYDEQHYDHRLFWHKVSTLMLEFWKIQKPQMLIEVTGTASEMRSMSPQMLKNLKSGIVRTAARAKAWLITGGANRGVMKLVGDAMIEHREKNGGSAIPCIGIASWGVLADGYEAFSVDKLRNGVLEYDYKNDQRKTAENYYELNPGYEHYLLIDTAKDKRYGQEISFRSKLLQYLSEQRPERSEIKDAKTPLVLLVVGGGKNTLTTVEKATKVADNELPRPIVIVKGFGGCADFLAAVSKQQQKGGEERDSAIRNDAFFWEWHKGRATDDASIARTVGELARICETIFNPNNSSHVVDMATFEQNDRALEDAILEAIFAQSNKLKPVTEANERKEQKNNWIRNTFALALQWNRGDFAERLLSDNASASAIRDESNAKFLTKAMTISIKHNQWRIFKLFIEMGLVEPYRYFVKTHEGDQLAVIFHKLFFHPSSWMSHKSKVSPGQWQILKRLSKFKLAADSAFKLPNKHVDITKVKLSKIKDTMSESFAMNARTLPKPIDLRDVDQKNDNNKYNLIIKNLLMLQLFLGRDDMAVVVWQLALTSDYLGTAVMAAIFLRKLSQIAQQIHRQDLGERYEKLSQKWENRASSLINHLDIGFRASKLAKIMTRKLALWNNLNVFELAYTGSIQTVISAPPVQVVLENIWKPPSTGSRLTSAPKASKTEQSPEPFQQLNRTLRYPYNVAPIVKFGLHAASLLAFLLVFIGVVIHSAHDVERCDNETMGLSVVIWLWSLAFTLESIQELFIFKIPNFENFITIIAQIFIIVASAIHWNGCQDQKALKYQDAYERFNSGKTIYALGCMLMCFKTFRVFQVGKIIGPKVWTLYEMFKDVAFFSVLHLIIICAFAAPIYALSKPTPLPENAQWAIEDFIALVPKVIYNRWWNIVGAYMDESMASTLGTGTCDKALSLDPAQQTSPFFRQYGPDFGDGSPESLDHTAVCNYSNVMANVLLAAFLLLTNIVLLNMLIANFSSTVQTVSDAAETLWRFERYHLCRGYAEKPVMPPPFSLLEMPFLLLIKFRDNESGRSNPFETNVSQPSDLACEGGDVSERNRCELKNYRYIELNKLEKAAVAKVIAEEQEKQN